MHQVNSPMLLAIGKPVVISENLKGRILERYESEVLELHLDNGNEEALYVLSQLVHMNFHAERMLYLAQKGDTKAIAQICKDNLEGVALMNELQRAFFDEQLH